VEIGRDKDSHNCHKEMDSLFDNQSWSVDLHSNHNSKTVESGLVNRMDIGHNQNSEHHRKTVHRQTCFRIDT
jgi:hypothetical protein